MKTHVGPHGVEREELGTPAPAQEQPAAPMTEAEQAQSRQGKPVVLPTSSSATVPTRPPTPPARGGKKQVHVAPHPIDLVTVPLDTPEERQAAREQRDLNEIVHGVLIVGLVVSATLMIVGVALDLLRHHELPTAVPNVGEVFRRVVALRPSGFLALGLLTLIATPILRVIGSIGAFLYEHDLRYAGITTLVLLVMITSILLGQG